MFLKQHSLVAFFVLASVAVATSRRLVDSGCPPGSAPGSSGCSPCSVGTYSTLSGCIACPQGLTTTRANSTGRDACGCARGTYGEGETCTSCPAGSTTTHVGAKTIEACKNMLEIAQSASPREVGMFLAKAMVNGSDFEIVDANYNGYRGAAGRFELGSHGFASDYQMTNGVVFSTGLAGVALALTPQAESDMDWGGAGDEGLRTRVAQGIPTGDFLRLKMTLVPLRNGTLTMPTVFATNEEDENNKEDLVFIFVNPKDQYPSSVVYAGWGNTEPSTVATAFSRHTPLRVSRMMAEKGLPIQIDIEVADGGHKLNKTQNRLKDSAVFFSPISLPPDVVCPEGQGLERGSCVVCSQGSYSSGGVNAECRRCVSGTTTQKRGASSARDCVKV